MYERDYVYSKRIEDLPIGAFVPCNVTVFEGEDGATYVQTLRPEIMSQQIDQPAVGTLADEVDDGLQRVFAAL